MAALNKVMLIGNLGRDPETRYMPDGTAVTQISLATTEVWKDKNGDKQEKTEWHRVAFFGKLAEVVGEYMKKGGQMYVEGRLQTRKWQDKDGNDKYTTEVVAQGMQMLGKPGGGRPDDGTSKEKADPEPAPEPAAKRETAKAGGKFDDFEDDIPF